MVCEYCAHTRYVVQYEVYCSTVLLPTLWAHHSQAATGHALEYDKRSAFYTVVLRHLHIIRRYTTQIFDCVVTCDASAAFSRGRRFGLGNPLRDEIAGTWTWHEVELVPNLNVSSTGR